MNYGERLRKIRSLLRFSQQEFADSIHIKNKQTISDTENGRQQELPSYAEIELEKKYGVNLTWLRAGEGEMYNSAGSVMDDGVVYNKLPADIETIVDILKDMDTKKRRVALKTVLDLSEVG